MRLVVPDLISPSYFPAIAAVELGLIRDQGLDVELDLLFPVTDAAGALQRGEIDFLAGAAHAPLSAFPQWKGAKLLMALAQKMYWFLVVRSDVDVSASTLAQLGGLKIGAAPGPDLGLRQLLRDAGVDAGALGIEVAPVPGTSSGSVSFGVTAAEALAAGAIDGFWANGMGAEVAVRQGIGRVVLDARRGDGPARAASYTFPALATTDRMIDERPDDVEAVVRGVLAAQRLLREDPSRATEVGERLFPAMEASIIGELIRRDAPYYDAEISQNTAAALCDFAREVGLLGDPVAYEQVVATRWRDLWLPAGA
jgi:ABC-type nitrate/sulfonate/bicarbonate transport system substrate-binding protein